MNALGDAIGGGAWPMTPTITAQRLMTLCPEADMTIITQLAPAFEQGAGNAQVTTLLRRAHFLAQMAHESGHFRRMVENLNYSAQRIREVWKHRPEIVARSESLAHNQEKLGNAAYANKNGNGNEASGDGFAYRGRGVVQLTGRGNYRAVGKWVDLNLEGNPTLAETPGNAAIIAYSFWRHAACNKFADVDDVRGVTKAINGGLTGLDARIFLTEKAKGIFV